MNGGALNNRMRNGLLGGGALLAAVLFLAFAPITFAPQERVPAKVFAARVWTLEHSGRGEVISRLVDREAGVSELLAVHSVDRGDVAGYRLAPGLGLGAQVTAGDTVGVFTSVRSDRELVELATRVEVAAAEAVTFSEGSKAARIEAARIELEQLRTELELQTRIVSRLRQLGEQGVVSVDEVERAETAEVELRGRVAVGEAELEVLRTGDRDSVRRLASTKLGSARDRLAALDTEREAHTTRAPISGTITRSPSDSVLVTVTDLGQWIVVSPVPDALVSELEVDAAVTVEASHGPLEAVVAHIDPATADLGGESVTLVTLRLQNPPSNLRDRQEALLILSGPVETLQARAWSAVASLFTWKTWWSHAPRA